MGLGFWSAVGADVEGEVGLDQGGEVFAGEEAGGVGVDLDAGGDAHLAGFEVEGPLVPGADGAAVFDPSAGEGAVGVGAAVVDGVGDAVVEEDGELEAVDVDEFSLTFREHVEIAKGGPGHKGSCCLWHGFSNHAESIKISLKVGSRNSYAVCTG
jgi:hypothetical protein